MFPIPIGTKLRHTLCIFAKSLTKNDTRQFNATDPHLLFYKNQIKRDIFQNRKQPDFDELGSENPYRENEEILPGKNQNCLREIANSA